MLQVDRISVRPGRKAPVLLRELTFTVPPGELLVVLGANGSGKSTLLKAVGGEIPLEDGAVRWKGTKVGDHRLEDLARERAFLDQHGTVPFAYTAREVVMMGRYPWYTSVPSVADELAVGRAVAAMRLDDQQHRAMPTLSGGERQRAHLARVLAQLDDDRAEASLLLLDEPLNDLDIKHQHTLLAMARGHAEAGNCVLAVLHDVNLASQYAHHITLLKQGRIIAHGTPGEVLRKGPLSEAYGLPARISRHPFLDGPWVHFDAALDTSPQPPHHHSGHLIASAKAS